MSEIIWRRPASRDSGSSRMKSVRDVTDVTVVTYVTTDINSGALNENYDVLTRRCGPRGHPWIKL